jgi:hypothetical protein
MVKTRGVLQEEFLRTLRPLIVLGNDIFQPRPPPSSPVVENDFPKKTSSERLFFRDFEVEK